MMNGFQPCVKLIRKERVGSKLRRTYDEARTPLDRLAESGVQSPALTRMLKRREAADPFKISASIQKQLKSFTTPRQTRKKHVA